LQVSIRPVADIASLRNAQRVRASCSSTAEHSALCCTTNKPAAKRGLSYVRNARRRTRRTGIAGRLNDASRGVDALDELLKRRLLRALVIARRCRFSSGGCRHSARGLFQFRDPRIHDVGSLYDAHVRCGGKRVQAMHVPSSLIARWLVIRPESRSTNVENSSRKTRRAYIFDQRLSRAADDKCCITVKTLILRKN